MPDTFWLANARKYIGLKEVPGKGTNATIANWLAKLKAPWRDDETAWCGTFQANNFLEVGLTPPPKWASARGWQALPKIGGPAVGAIVVFWRGSPTGWSGHVGLVVGRDKLGHLMVLGGNQGDMVQVSPFGLERVLGYYWPEGRGLPSVVGFNLLPVVDSNGRVSVNEA